MSIEDFDAWENQNPSFEGVKEARHMSEGDMQGLFFQDTSKPSISFESISRGPYLNGKYTDSNGEKFKLVAGDERVMNYRVLEGEYIHMELTGEGFFWTEPSKDNPLSKAFTINKKMSKPWCSQANATFYLNRYWVSETPEWRLEDVHAFVVGLFKDFAHSQWSGGENGYWLSYDEKSDKPAKGLPKAIDILLKEDA